MGELLNENSTESGDLRKVNSRIRFPEDGDIIRSAHKEKV
jgi:hypothetical protein